MTATTILAKDEIIPNGLPLVLDEIAEVAGVEAAMSIAAHFGGSVIYIPASPGETHPLSLAVGYEAAKAIGDYYSAGSAASNHHRSGTQLLIPKGFTSVTEAQVRQAYEVHGSSNKVARALGVHERTARRWRQRIRGADQVANSRLQNTKASQS